MHENFGKSKTNFIESNTERNQYWIIWKQILIDGGLLKAANAITRTKCKQCNNVEIMARSFYNTFDSDVDSIVIYNSENMNNFSLQGQKNLENQFGKWTPVYIVLPKLKFPTMEL